MFSWNSVSYRIEQVVILASSLVKNLGRRISVCKDHLISMIEAPWQFLLTRTFQIIKPETMIIKNTVVIKFMVLENEYSFIFFVHSDQICILKFENKPLK